MVRVENTAKLGHHRRAQEGPTQAEPITIENRDYHRLIGLCLIDVITTPASLRPE
jgi:hypothetical protein